MVQFATSLGNFTDREVNMQLFLHCQVSLHKSATVPVKDMNRSTSAESLEMDLPSGRGLPLTVLIETMKFHYHLYSQMEVVTMDQ